MIFSQAWLVTNRNIGEDRWSVSYRSMDDSKIAASLKRLPQHGLPLTNLHLWSFLPINVSCPSQLLLAFITGGGGCCWVLVLSWVFVALWVPWAFLLPARWESFNSEQIALYTWCKYKSFKTAIVTFTIIVCDLFLSIL